MLSPSAASGFAPHVYISLTTFPLRISTLLKDSLLDLMKQDYRGVKGIYVTIPMENMRGQRAEETLPKWFSEEPIASRITVIRPEKDAGPILKYIGAASFIPQDAWLFTCDDDQRYAHNYISKLVALAGKNSNADSRNRTIYNCALTLELDVLMCSMRLISGFWGVFYSRLFLDCILANFSPTLPIESRRVDDDLVSLYARDNNFKVKSVPMGISLKHFLRSNTPSSLHATGKRRSDRHFTHKMLNMKYADNLDIARITLLIISLVLIVIVIVLAVCLSKKGKNVTR